MESQDNDLVQVTVEDQHTASKKHKIDNRAGPSGAKKVTGKQIKEVMSVAPWVGEQGRKVMSVAGLTFNREDEVGKYTARKLLDKGKDSPRVKS